MQNRQGNQAGQPLFWCPAASEVCIMQTFKNTVHNYAGLHLRNLLAKGIGSEPEQAQRCHHQHCFCKVRDPTLAFQYPLEGAPSSTCPVLPIAPKITVRAASLLLQKGMQNPASPSGLTIYFTRELVVDCVIKWT